ncbi:DNA-binding transcriptional regulator, MerR family [Modestobacter sp. DSM 44400]|uniref:heavy metal-responsive transcriptional regulator n=1 Tax=Modestobacter sp. DSM 44400 TaxID=1550230 RepID=UPI00089BFD26|nr:heavy metal-responsive transcriptional regulator [Modestobacter sp. DSM 44400]SDY05140.1 DNA-binding transcriptional regulator, MerR family [Modestobacter sp. DSM 44400]
MRIGKVATAAGISTKALRFYETAGLLPPPARTSAGYRDYSNETLPRLDFIRRSRGAGLTLAEIREVLEIRDSGDAPCEHVQHLLGRRLADLDRQIADLLELRATVAGLHAGTAAADPETCDPATVCRYL